MSILFFIFSTLSADSTVIPKHNPDLSSVPSLIALRKRKEVRPQKVKKPVLRQRQRNHYENPELINKQVSISLKDVAISDAIELIGKLVEINFVVGNDVYGRVNNVNFKNVSVSYVLKVLLSNNNPKLALKKEQGVYHITCLGQALESYHDKAVVTLQHVSFTDAVKKRIKRMWRGITENKKQGVYLVFDDQSKKIFFRGEKHHVNDMKAYFHEIDVKLPQVKIEARIVIAKKDFDESLGLQVSGVYNRKASMRMGPLTDIRNEPNDQPASSLVDWALNLFPDSGIASRKINLPFVFGGRDLNTRRLNLVLSAAENRGEIKTILKPSILTNHGQESKISVGDSVPIETIVKESIEGTLRDVTTATYKDVGTVLKVKPLVSPDKKTITLDIFVENSSHSMHNKFPLISSAKTKCRVMLKNGQTAMIGGLIEKTKKKNHSSIPILRNIPIIGNLFKGSHKEVRDHQLLIFITPTVVT